MKTTRLEFDHNWSPRKEGMMQRDILVFLRQMGAGNPRWIATEETAPEPVLYLHLRCIKCGVDWYADSFQPCPKCLMRETIERAEPGRVPLPPPADAPPSAA